MQSDQDREPPARSFRCMIVAGEASGDLHGSYLMRSMKEMVPSIFFYGIGGEKMANEGMHLLARSSDLAVMGLVEVFFRIPVILSVMRRLKRSFDTEPPDLLILIDYPGFNLSLAKTAKIKGIKVFYYIGPKVWAWRKGRVRKIRAFVDQMALILPFEEELYRTAGVPATFVGHPLLDEITAHKTVSEIKAELKLNGHGITIALLPGSREGEVRNLLPGMLKAARILQNRFSSIQFVLPIAQTVRPEWINGIMEQEAIPVCLVNGQTHEILSVSDVAVVASGTATLETALMGKPMVIVYKVSPLTYFLGKMVVKIKHAGLPNIIAGRAIVPELIQKDFTPERLAGEVSLILKDLQVRDRMIKDLLDIKNTLGEAGASQRAAQLACSMLT
ncbi:MAG: lipid-A-disaccharide synthase [Syntrophaceae bacterium]|nr:lipid-A-disaccharide synthase [Syntrophaceae bacterium]